MGFDIKELETHLCKPQECVFNGLTFNVKKVNQVVRGYIAKSIVDYIFANPLIEVANDKELSELKNYYSFKNIVYVNMLIAHYTDIKMDSESLLENANIIINSGLYDFVLSKIPQREIDLLLDEINSAIEMKKFDLLLGKLDEVKAESLETQLSRFLQMAIDKIPTDKKLLSFIKSAKKEFNGFKLDKFPEVKKLLETLGEKNIPSAEDLNATIGNVEKLINQNNKKEN